MNNVQNKSLEKDKMELFLVIESINNPKMIKYILGFVKAFIDLRK